MKPINLQQISGFQYSRYCIIRDKAKTPSVYGGVSVFAYREIAYAAMGVSAKAASSAAMSFAMLSSVSSPMFEMRKVLPLSFP